MYAGTNNIPERPFTNLMLSEWVWGVNVAISANPLTWVLHGEAGLELDAKWEFRAADTEQPPGMLHREQINGTSGNASQRTLNRIWRHSILPQWKAGKTIFV